MNTKIILAEEELDVASQAQCCLNAEGYDVYRFNDGVHLLERVSELSLSCCREPWLAIISLPLARWGWRAGMPTVACGVRLADYTCRNWAGSA